MGGWLDQGGNKAISALIEVEIELSWGKLGNTWDSDWSQDGNKPFDPEIFVVFVVGRGNIVGLM